MRNACLFLSCCVFNVDFYGLRITAELGVSSHKKPAGINARQDATKLLPNVKVVCFASCACFNTNLIKNGFSSFIAALSPQYVIILWSIKVSIGLLFVSKRQLNSKRIYSFLLFTLTWNGFRRRAWAQHRLHTIKIHRKAAKMLRFQWRCLEKNMVCNSCPTGQQQFPPREGWRSWLISRKSRADR